LVTVFLNTFNDVKLTTLGGKLFQATTARSLKKFNRVAQIEAYCEDHYRTVSLQTEQCTNDQLENVIAVTEQECL